MSKPHLQPGRSGKPKWNGAHLQVQGSLAPVQDEYQPERLGNRVGFSPEYIDEVRAHLLWRRERGLPVSSKHMSQNFPCSWPETVQLSKRL